MRCAPFGDVVVLLCVVRQLASATHLRTGRLQAPLRGAGTAGAAAGSIAAGVQRVSVDGIDGDGDGDDDDDSVRS